MSVSSAESEMTYVPSGKFVSVHGDRTATVFTGGDITDRLRELVDCFHQALSNDRAEVENAKAAADGPLCTDGYDATTTQQDFDAFIARVTANLGRLVGEENVGGIGEDSVVGGVMGPWAATADGPGKNQSPYDGWAKATMLLEQIVADTQAETINSWQSAAGDSYRQNALDQTKRLASLESLTTNTRDLVESVSLIQGIVSEAIHGAIGKRLKWCKEAAKMTPTPIKDFKDEGDKFWKETDFFMRAAVVDACVCEVIDFVAFTDEETQPWIQAAKQLGVKLEAATEATRQLLTRESDYSSGTTVAETGQCNIPKGQKGTDSLF